MADVEAVVTVAQTKWQRLIPVSMEAYADIFGIWAADAGETDGEDGRRKDGRHPYGSQITGSDHGHPATGHHPR